MGLWIDTTRRAVRLAEMAIDPDFDVHVPDSYGCSGCGATALDLLTWDDDGDAMTCALCGTTSREEVLP